MPVMSCAGTAPCKRFVSVSAVPGGNPSAKADPERFASEWTRCTCGKYTCDRCLQRQGDKCTCGSTAHLLDEPARIQIAMDMMLGKSAAGAQAVAVARVQTPGVDIEGLDPATRMAVWITLAFLDIALADGKVVDAEFAAWKACMTRMNLPDVLGRFGTEGLLAMLKAGDLQRLTARYVALPPETRGQMTQLLLEFVVADGSIDPREVQVLERITGWLGVKVSIEPTN